MVEEESMTALNLSAQQQLRQFVEQLERLDEEKRAVQDDMKDKFAEMKALGFDTKAVRKLLKLRKMSRDARLEEEAILTTYMHAIGMEE